MASIQEMMSRGILGSRQVEGLQPSLQGLQSTLPQAPAPASFKNMLGAMTGGKPMQGAAGPIASKVMGNMWWLLPLLLEMGGSKVIGDVREIQGIGQQTRAVEQQTEAISPETMMQQMLMPMLMQESGGMEQMLMQVLAGAGGGNDLASGEERIGGRGRR